jgi:hypothetical protein
LYPKNNKIILKERQYIVFIEIQLRSEKIKKHGEGVSFLLTKSQAIPGVSFYDDYVYVALFTEKNNNIL